MALSLSSKLYSTSLLKNTFKIGFLNNNNLYSKLFSNQNALKPLNIRNLNNLQNQRSLFSQTNINKNSLLKEKLINFHQTRNMFIDVDATPNVNTLKFKPAGVKILPDNQTIEFLTMEKAERQSPLAQELMEVEGIESILFGSDFITITKDQDYEWQMLKPDIYVIVTDYIESGEPIIVENSNIKNTSAQETKTESKEESKPKRVPSNSIEAEIIELINTKIKPAIQQDGGDVEYLEYKDGIVKVSLHGACRSCSMAEVTLKNGIENMLKHYIPEIKSVERVMTDKK